VLKYSDCWHAEQVSHTLEPTQSLRSCHKLSALLEAPAVLISDLAKAKFLLCSALELAKAKLLPYSAAQVALQV